MSFKCAIFALAFVSVVSASPLLDDFIDIFKNLVTEIESAASKLPVSLDAVSQIQKAENSTDLLKQALINTGDQFKLNLTNLESSSPAKDIKALVVEQFGGQAKLILQKIGNPAENVFKVVSNASNQTATTFLGFAKTSLKALDAQNQLVTFKEIGNKALSALKLSSLQQAASNNPFSSVLLGYSGY